MHVRAVRCPPVQAPQQASTQPRSDPLRSEISIGDCVENSVHVCMSVCVWSFTCFSPSGTHTAVGKYQNQTSLATQRNQHRRWCREVGPRVCMCLCVYVRVLAVRCSAPGTASWEPSQIWRLCPRQLSLSISIYIYLSLFTLLHYTTSTPPSVAMWSNDLLSSRLASRVIATHFVTEVVNDIHMLPAGEGHG